MKKKLILLPISLVSCLVGGCAHQAAHLSFTDILEKKADYAYFKINNDSHYDYDFKIREIIKGYSGSLSKQAVYWNGSANNLCMEFDIYPSSRTDFDSLKIYFYDDGRVNTICSGEGMLTHAYEQKTSYTMSKNDLANLQKDINDRLDEVDRIFKEEEAKVKEYATPDKFFELLENPKDGFKPWVDTYLDNSNQSKRISNITPELIQDLKNLDYKEVEGANVPEEFSYIEIRASDDWQLTIYKNVPYASSYYIYGNTLTITSLSVVYSINEEMRSALVNRCQEMIENNTYYK